SREDGHPRQRRAARRALADRAQGQGLRARQDARREDEGVHPPADVRSRAAGRHRQPRRRPRDRESTPQERPRQMLRRRHQPQTQAPRETERGQEADEAGGEGGDSAGGVFGGVENRLTARPPARLRGCSRPPCPPVFHTNRTPVPPRTPGGVLLFAKNSARLRARGATGARAGENRGKGGREQPRNRSGGRVSLAHFQLFDGTTGELAWRDRQMKQRVAMTTKTALLALTASTLLTAAAANAAGIDMNDPRRALGRENDVRIDAQLLQETVSPGTAIAVTYQIQ